VNYALKCLQQNLPPAETARRLAQVHGVSTRQAYRYVQLARQAAEPLLIPEGKAVFTLKLSCRLIRRVRRRARQSGLTISDWVAAALRQALSADSAHG
jgi:hypothetical protein